MTIPPTMANFDLSPPPVMTSHLFIDQYRLDPPEWSGGESRLGGGVVRRGAWCNHDATRLWREQRYVV